MSTETILAVRSVAAGADLSTSTHLIVKLNSSGAAVLAAASTDPIVGVLQNYPSSGQQATYAFSGTAKVVAGGTIAVGAWVTSNSSGQAIATTTPGDVIIGRYVGTAAAASGDLAEIQLGIGTLYHA
jgi:hypothetical protein